MFLSRPSRRWIARVAALLVVACHTVSVAQAAAAGAPQPGSETASLPCHALHAGGAGNDVSPTNCDRAASSSAKTGSFDSHAMDMPVATVHVDRLAAVMDLRSPPELRPARVEPPPLTILNCCLRN